MCVCVLLRQLLWIGSSFMLDVCCQPNGLLYVNRRWKSWSEKSYVCYDSIIPKYVHPSIFLDLGCLQECHTIKLKGPSFYERFFTRVYIMQFHIQHVISYFFSFHISRPSSHLDHMTMVNGTIATHNIIVWI